MGIFRRLFGKSCSECGKRLVSTLSTEGLESKSSGRYMTVSGKQFLEAMDKKFSLAVQCEKCNTSYCAGCCLEVWHQGGPARFICPRCHSDLGDASMLV